MMSHRMRIIPLVVLLGVIGPAGAARADDAKRAFDEGITLFNRGDIVGAIEAFERAYKIKPHYHVQCNLARCYEQRSEMVRAAKHYRRCLAEGAKASTSAAEVRASLLAVESRITRVRVTSPGDPGEVFLDGKEQGRTPLTMQVDPGSHVVEARWRNGSARKTLTTRGGDSQEIVFEAIERVPATRPAITPPPPSSRLPARGRLHPAWFWSGVGLTVALSVVTAVLGAQTLQLRDDFEQDPTRANYDRAVTRRLLTNVFLAGALAAAGTTTTLAFFTSFSRERPDHSVAVGVQLGGSF
jgi:hypothetical protein